MLCHMKRRSKMLIFLFVLSLLIFSLLSSVSTVFGADKKAGGEHLVVVASSSEVKDNVSGAGSNLRKVGVVDFEPKAVLVNDSDSKVEYRYDGLVDYKNVNLVWYFSYGFFNTFEDNLKNYVKFYNKETGKDMKLPNQVTQPIEVDEYYMEVTDWWFKRISGRAPLGLTLKSIDLEPSQTYVVEIAKGFTFNNGKKMEMTYSFEFTTSSSSPLPVNEKAEEEAVIFPNDIAGHWAEDTIKQVVTSGAMGGYPDHSFRPENSITRAEFTAALVKALNLTKREGKVFSDTSGHWAEDFISTATAYGIITGYDTDTFAPDKRITREQMAVMIGKAERMIAIEVGKSFSDGDKISLWAKDAVAWVSKHNIMSGYPDNSFHPKSFATRAEVAAIIPRL